MKNAKRFARIYNNTTRFPSMRAVAEELKMGIRTIRDHAIALRALRAAGHDVPEIVNRGQKPAVNDNQPKVSPEEHAHKRAANLKTEIDALVTGSRYPLLNPDAIIVESFTWTRYDRRSGTHRVVEGMPRTWLSDTLRVAPIAKTKGRRFIFTGAQNDSPVHQGFWKNLKAFAAHIGAELIVGAWTYETQWWSENNPTARAYDAALDEHLCFGQMALGDRLLFCGEMNTLPTASQPVTDLAAYARGRWAIFPHAKRQLKSVPSTDPTIQAHQVMTTGACTIPKVVPRKAGVKSIFHHAIGAVLVEFDQDGDFFCRHLSADADGSFYDLDRHVSNGKVKVGQAVAGIVFGDIHVAKATSRNVLATFGFDHRGAKTQKGSVIEALKPQTVFLHDLFDNQTRNHHHQKDNAHNYELAVRRREDVFGEIQDAGAFLRRVLGKGRDVVVVESNHDIALERYVREGRYRMDGRNIKLGLELETAYLTYREKVAAAIEEQTSPPSFSMLEYALRRLDPGLGKSVRWVYDGKSCLLNGVECGHHGFRGPNGARGNVAGFVRLGVKMSIADKHAPEINEGLFVAGVMELQHGYNKGPSGWAVAHIVQYPNGKRALITMQNGKWRAP